MEKGYLSIVSPLGLNYYTVLGYYFFGYYFFYTAVAT